MDAPPEQIFVDRASRHVLASSGLIVLARVISVLAVVVSVPIVIGRLGSEGYGVWESILAIAAMALTVQIVVGGVMIWRISMCCGSNDRLESQRMVRLGVAFTLLLTAVLAPASWLLRDDAVTTLQVPAQWSEDCRLLIPLVVGMMLLGGLNQVLLAVIIGYQRSGLSAIIQSIGLLVTQLAAIAALELNCGLHALLIGYLIGMAATFAIAYPFARSLCGRLSLVPAWPTASDFTALAPFAGLLLVSNLTLLFRDHADKLVLASLVSPTSVGHFSVAQRLASTVMLIGAACFLPFTAAVGALHAQQDQSGIRNLYERTAMWTSAFAGFLAVFVCVLRRPLFVLWLGRDQPEAYPFLLLLLLGATAATILAGAAVGAAKGIGRPGLETTYALVTMLLIVLTKPLAIAALGPIGAVASSAGSWSVGALCCLLLLHKELQLSPVVIRRSLGALLLTLIVGGGGWWLGGEIFVNVAERWQAALVLLLVTPLLAIVYFGILVSLGVLRIHFPRSIISPIRALEISSQTHETAATDLAA